MVRQADPFLGPPTVVGESDFLDFGGFGIAIKATWSDRVLRGSWQCVYAPGDLVFEFAFWNAFRSF